MEFITSIKNYLKRNHYDSFPVKTILFDMDGVLYDSMPAHASSWEKTVKELGIACHADEFYQYEGQTGRQTICQLFERGFGRPSTDEENKRVYAQKTKYFSDHGPAPIMKGASEVLRKTVLANYIPVLVTGSGQATLLDKLSHNFPGIFIRERMVTALDVDKGKPHPEPYLRGLKKTASLANEAIVIENAPLGVRSAVAAGIFTIAVNTGPIPASQLYAEGADIVLSGMEELNDRFEELLKAIHEVNK
ncbi:MAG: HAD family hydrolase [Bacteroidales bacterium]